MIYSEQVPRGKGEKQPGEGDEIESETVHLQSSGSPDIARCRGWPRAYWRMTQRVRGTAAYLSRNNGVGIVKASVNSA